MDANKKTAVLPFFAPKNICTLDNKFDEALKSASKQEQQGSGAFIGKRYYDRLFAIEKLLAHLSPDDRHEKRREQASPVLDEFLRG